MFAEERQKKIFEFILNKRRVSVKELCEKFEASESTIRRDLSYLSKKKKIKRTHGGAIVLDEVNINVEPTFLEKKEENTKEKQLIGEKAFSFIKENDTIFLDAGTTVLELAKCIGNSSMKLTIITNSMMAAQLVANNSNIDLIITGGIVRLNTLAIVGDITKETFQKFNVNKAFIGTNGISITNGLTTPHLLEAETKAMMIKNSLKNYVLADHTKFDKVALCKIASINEVDKIITDKNVSLWVIEEYSKFNVEVITS